LKILNLVKISRGNRKEYFFCILLSIPLGIFQVSAQNQDPPEGPKLPTFIDRNPNLLPHKFEKDKAVGSPYLTKSWATGYVELVNNKRIPETNQDVLFNYDKMENVLYVLDNLSKMRTLPIDSISKFELVENNMTYTFEKMTWISKKFYLTPVIESPNGYSLYKRLITNYYWADYSSDGYTTKGRKYDEFIDSYEYFLTYPGNKTYRKLLLKESAVRHAFKDDSKLLDAFFDLHDDEINEQSVLGIVQYINDKKYPD
jgi:hypothetical protein